MGFFQRNKTNKIIVKFIIVIILSISFISLFQWKNVLVYKANANIHNTEITKLIDDIFENRNKALLKGDLEFIESIYDTDTKYGVWAYEHEKKKIKYLHNWEKKQGVKFIDIKPKVVIRNIKENKDKYSINLLCSTEYKYIYENEPEKVNTSTIGTNHLVNLAKQEDEWVITKEWYKDPFADSLNINNLKKPDDIREYILSNSSRDFSDLNERRLSSIEYADKYCGTASNGKYGYKYNKKYRNYNPQGGDCANFASQILFEGGKFRKNSAWNYDSKGATRAWVNADGFKDYMIYSGRASVIAHGDYEKVYKASYNLLPGDFVAYEKKGDITHISVVTGADSKGYSLVSCHNTDRNKVPWDLGWNDKGIKFWLVRVHF
ncbi:MULTISPECIES: amidase domain-containing protein [Clostridium]|uniref:Amidase domain-containing protein n=2 Tax=Clostridium sporogenes TaxID=1509 RepID=A0A7X5P6E0_CLOSG|nr:amidase domain-containing protein [Clostridium sporogenes]AJD33069.1 putative amidase domain protein [Clostridium botulinum Prevot_594]KRU38036.1 putative amidase domain-containing protein [Clostridium sporogenes]MBY7014576.1 amidase domain-containing protein [Clostridium sporogenes]MBY7064168.1 amidase domain-containing protein [Clostridium sporogenes]MBY7069436.1 amidase domain-containing protein [Clostridium sporogenes]